jgi:hypothetical protein
MMPQQTTEQRSSLTNQVGTNQVGANKTARNKAVTGKAGKTVLGGILRASPALALTLGAAAPAMAGFPVETEMVCPVGGETFTHISTGSYSTFGARPDGKPYGSWTFPLAIPECPSNGLVMFRDFDEDEIAQLTEYLASDGFAQIRQDVSYFRAAKIAEILSKDGSYGVGGLLLRASWQSDHDPLAKARYQRAFASYVTAIEPDSENIDWLFLTARSANAHRELGEFEAAESVLNQLPERLIPDEMEGKDLGFQERQRYRSLAYLDEYRESLRAEIDAENTESEPLAMLPENVAASYCLELAEAGSDPLPPSCTSGPVQERMAQFAEVRRDMETDGIVEEAVAAAIALEAEEAAQLSGEVVVEEGDDPHTLKGTITLDPPE